MKAQKRGEQAGYKKNLAKCSDNFSIAVTQDTEGEIRRWIARDIDDVARPDCGGESPARDCIQHAKEGDCPKAGQSDRPMAIYLLSVNQDRLNTDERGDSEGED